MIEDKSGGGGDGGGDGCIGSGTILLGGRSLKGKERERRGFLVCRYFLSKVLFSKCQRYYF
jgi:hypothetical protein